MSTKLLTLKQTGEALQLSESTVARLVANSQLRVIRINRSVRCPEDEIARFIEARQADAAGAA